MPRSRTPKTDSEQTPDPVSLIGDFATVEQPQPKELVVGPDEAANDPTAPQPTVSVDDDGTIVIK